VRKLWIPLAAKKRGTAFRVNGGAQARNGRVRSAGVANRESPLFMRVSGRPTGSHPPSGCLRRNPDRCRVESLWKSGSQGCAGSKRFAIVDLSAGEAFRCSQAGEEIESPPEVVASLVEQPQESCPGHRAGKSGTSAPAGYRFRGTSRTRSLMESIPSGAVRAKV
jgi:hypothetical protein